MVARHPHSFWYNLSHCGSVQVCHIPKSEPDPYALRRGYFVAILTLSGSKGFVQSSSNPLHPMQGTGRLTVALPHSSSVSQLRDPPPRRVENRFPHFSFFFVLIVPTSISTMSKSLPSTNPGTTDSNPPVTDPSAPSYTSSLAHLRQKLATPIDATACIPISLYACFLTGFTSSPSFSACYIWCGFQTGNLAQLGLALARTFAPIDEYRTYGIQKPDQQALVSLFSFIIGATLGRFGDAVGAKTRRWLVGATGLQVLLSAAAALTAHYSGESGIAL